MTLSDFAAQLPAASFLAALEQDDRVAAFADLEALAAEVSDDADVARRAVRVLRAQVEDLGRWRGYRYQW